jgi:TolB-like protein
MTCWTNSLTNFGRLLLLALLAIGLAGCAAVGGPGGAAGRPEPVALVGSPVRLVARAAGPAEVAGQLYEVHLRRDGRDLGAVHAGTEPVWEWTPQEPGTYQTKTVVRDAAGQILVESSWSEPWQIALRLELKSLAADRPGPQTVGTSIRWQAQAVGGAGPLTYEFELRDESGRSLITQTGPSPELGWSPREAGRYQVRVTVNDAAGNAAAGDWSAPYEIVPRLEVKSLAPDRPAPQVAGMTSVRWRVEAFGGVGERRYEFQLRPEGGEATTQQSGSFSEWVWNPRAPGRFQVRVVTVDARGNRAAGDWSEPYEIAPMLAVGRLQAAKSAPQTAGTAIRWQAEASGGVGRHTWDFYLLEGEKEVPVLKGSPVPVWNWTPQQPETFRVRAEVGDAMGNRAASSWSEPYEIVPRLQVKTPDADRTSPQNARTPITWKVQATGGVGERTYKFLLRSEDRPERAFQVGPSPEWFWKPGEPGRYQVRVTVSDALGNTAYGDWSAPFEIARKLEVKPPAPSLLSPQTAKRTTITWKAAAVGGGGEVTIRFLLQREGEAETLVQAGPSPIWDWTPGEAGRYRVQAAVSDALGNAAQSGWSAPYEITPLPDAEILAPDRDSPQGAGLVPITWRATLPAVEAKELTYEFHLRRDDGREAVVQKGSSPAWQWMPGEPGRYQVRALVRDAAGLVTDSGWSEPYLITPALIAVLPFENLSASPAPLVEMRQAFLERLRSAGMNLLPEAELEAFMARHRLRYTGGLGKAAALAFREEAGVAAVLITDLTLFDDIDPPRVALAARLVATGTEPRIVWADSFATAGNEAPGLLDLGMVHDVGILRDRALQGLTASLAAHLTGRQHQPKGDRAFRPRVQYRSRDFAADRTYTVAILPFVNRSGRRFAGELLALHFLEELERAGAFRVMEPGLVREELLRLRIIIPEGASLDTAGILFDRLKVDLLLSGKVLSYEDQAGTAGAPQAYFTVQVIDQENQEMIWSSQSSNAGNDGVFLFEQGWVRTAQDLATRMAREVVRGLAAPGRP